MTTKAEHIDTLARTLYGEAKPHDIQDATAIACVVMNRVALPTGRMTWKASASSRINSAAGIRVTRTGCGYSRRMAHGLINACRSL